MTDSIDQLISVARVFLDLFDTAGATALERDRYLDLPIGSKYSVSNQKSGASSTYGKREASLSSFIDNLTGLLTRPPISSSNASSSMSGIPPWFRTLLGELATYC